MRFRRFTILCALAVLVIYGLLIASLFYFFDGSAVLSALSSKRVLFSIQLSLVAATVATGLALLLAVPAAYALSRYRFRGHQAVDAILEFPIIVSPAALGAIILIFFSNPVGSWVQEHMIQFVFAFAGIVLAQFITVLGVAVRFMKSAFDQVPPRYETVARTLGASPSRAFFTVSLAAGPSGADRGRSALLGQGHGRVRSHHNRRRHHGHAHRDPARRHLHAPVQRRHQRHGGAHPGSAGHRVDRALRGQVAVWRTTCSNLTASPRARGPFSCATSR